MSSRSYGLVCLPFGGSEAHSFSAWEEKSSYGITVLPVRFPGRGDLSATYLAPRIAAMTEQARVAEFALFGHGLGALLCYETARIYERHGYPGLSQVYVSGSPGPWNGREGTGRTLRTPITVLRGEEDTVVPGALARRWWWCATEGRFRYIELPGGHMYPMESPELVLRTVAESLEDIPTPVRLDPVFRSGSVEAFRARRTSRES